VFRGWPTFTPDGRFIIGPSSQLSGFVMAGGCNAHGVSGSAGIGRHVVESMSEDTPSDYVRSLSPDRFASNGWNWETARRDAQHYYETLLFGALTNEREHIRRHHYRSRCGRVVYCHAIGQARGVSEGA
jgi:hypothetical protein